jgi:non-ribosomal peptide synthetase component F
MATAPVTGVRLVVLDLDTLRAALRELLAEVLSVPAAPDYYSQASLPPGMSRRAFLDAIRRGDLPARASGKVRFVSRADYQAFIKNARPVRVRIEKQPSPANDVRALVRAAQGKK